MIYDSLNESKWDTKRDRESDEETPESLFLYCMLKTAAYPRMDYMQCAI